LFKVVRRLRSLLNRDMLPRANHVAHTAMKCSLVALRRERWLTMKRIVSAEAV
jgi:hypothetical protein